MKIRHGIGWVLTLVVSFVFVFAGWGQASASPAFVGMWRAFEYPHWFMVCTGVLELGAVVLFVVPRTMRYGSALICAIMLGAAITHATHGQAGYAPMPIFFAVLTVGGAVLRGPSTST